MYLMYVDESGDSGNSQYSSPHFILSGLIIHYNNWNDHLDLLKNFRKYIKQKYGLNQRTEVHSSELIRVSKIEEYRNISKTNRINIFKDYVTEIPKIFNTGFIINICINKADHPGVDIFELAWKRLIQRYNTFLIKKEGSKGIIIADDTDSVKLMTLHRKMRVFNYVPSFYVGHPPRNVPINNIIEDVFYRKSHHSYFLQTVDVIVSSLYRKEYPKGSLRKFNLEFQFDKLKSILLTEASRGDKYGIVRR